MERLPHYSKKDILRKGHMYCRHTLHGQRVHAGLADDLDRKMHGRG